MVVPLVVSKRAQLLYARPLSVCAPVIAPSTRFVITCLARTGSQLLVSLLDAHPAIRCEAEILRERHPRVAPEVFLDSRAVIARLRHRSRAYGFKGLYNDLARLDDARATLRRLHDAGYAVVFLERRDVLAQTISFMHARQHDQWHHRAPDAATYERWRIDPAELIEAIEQTERWRDDLDSMVDGLPSVSFVYEDDLMDASMHQATVDKVCAVLGITTAPVRTDLVRITPGSISERVSNYDEVADALSASPYAHLVP